MRWLSRFIVTRRVWVLIATAVLAVASAVVGGNVAEKLSLGGTEDPASESVQTQELLEAAFKGAPQPDFVLIITAKDGTVDDEAVRDAGVALQAKLDADPGILQTQSYWSLDNAIALRSEDGRQAMVLAALAGTPDERIDHAGELSAEYAVDTKLIRVGVTGKSTIEEQISERAEKDLQRSEFLTAPLVFIALVIVFGSLVAAFLPLVVGVLAILGTFVVLTLLAKVTTVSVFALNLTTALGLGLAIDYSLFIVSRYREELARGVSQLVAVGRTMQTAGRTVAFSAATVMISLLALALFPMPYLRSFAFAGVAVVGLAAVASIVVLPAILAVLGPRVEKGRVFKVKSDPGKFWRGQAARVMRHPWPYAIGVSALLVVLAIPFFRVSLGLTDDRVVPIGSIEARQPTQDIRDNFASRENNALQVAIPGLDVNSDQAKIDALARRLLVLPGVARVDAATGTYGATVEGDRATALTALASVEGSGVEALAGGRFIVPATLAPKAVTARFTPDDGGRGTWLSVVPDVEPFSDEGAALVADIRGSETPYDFGVTGTSTRLVDTKAVVVARLPWVILAIALATFVLLFLMTGSLLVPAQGADPERAEPHRDVRRDGVDLPGRPLLWRPRFRHRPGASTSSRRC